MTSPALHSAVASVPPGAWAVGVSGGADSVALLGLLRTRADLRLHVVHLDHETRGEESTRDAEFVRALAMRWNFPATISRLSEIETGLQEIAANPSARYRAARAALFRKVVAEHGLAGVVLAHHADDQAETILHRLLRASGPMGLAGMEIRTDLGGLVVLRPLLGLSRDAVRGYLKDIGQDWREDASNAGDKYLRNRIRSSLEQKPELTAGVLKLGEACQGLRDWARSAAVDLPANFLVTSLAVLPPTLAGENARRWLAARGVPPAEITPQVTDRLIRMCADAASPPRRISRGDCSSEDGGV